MDFRNNIKELARLRNELAFYTSERKKLIQAVEESDDYKNLSASEKQLKAVVDELTAEIKAAAVLEYQETGEKKYPYGLSIRSGGQEVDYEPEKVLEWAKTNAPYLIKHVLNTSLFESTVKSAADQFSELATVKDAAPMATLPTDLDKAIEKEDGAK